MNGFLHTKRSPLPHIAWLLLAGLGLLVQLVLLWNSLLNPYSEWAILRSYTAVKALFSMDGYVLYILVLRVVVSCIFWVGAVGVVWHTRGEGRSMGWVEAVAAMCLALMPILFVLNGFDAQMEYEGLLTSVISLLSPMLSLWALLLYLLLAYILPDGRFEPRWLVFGCMAFLATLTILFLLPVVDFEPDWIWVVTLLVLLAAMLTGLGSQIYRFRRMDAGERHQSRGLYLALMAQPLAFLGGMLLYGESTLGGLLSLHLQYAVLALLPISLLEAIQRRGLWSADGTQIFRLRPMWAAGIALAISTGLWIAYPAVQSKAAESLSFEPLPASPQPRPVIIDTDLDPNDSMAVLFMLQRPDVKVLAITVSGTGEVHCEPGVRIARLLVEVAGESGIPVACGRETPLEGNHVFPEELRTNADTMNGIGLPESKAPSDGPGAVELLLSTTRASPGKVSLLALGPLTNLAEAIQREPAFLNNVQEIVTMGGALQVLGNVFYFGIDNQVAEWNFYIDPLAVKLVLESGAPVTLVPLDATNDVPIDLAFYRLLKANQHTPEAQFVFTLLTHQLDFVASGGYYFWDPLAAALLVDPGIGYIKAGQVKVFTAEGPSSGLTRLMSGGAHVRYATSADAGRFQYEYLRALNQP